MRKILPPSIKEEEIEKLIADVDSDNNDGRISFEEFKRAFTDENHDKISRLYAEKLQGTNIFIPM